MCIVEKSLSVIEISFEIIQTFSLNEIKLNYYLYPDTDCNLEKSHYNRNQTSGNLCERFWNQSNRSNC